ncbi:MAG: 4-(cytidine 5'-diphospho)-2-C-methyl-D-erythritol kinase [Lachnospiraceae bacterium]|nr:4-(cytidine 5'-diphospho)-2-C-methyl-D-erythritol kinase [Lachnospiraceae bacterium]
MEYGKKAKTTKEAHAKINLGLDIIGRRDDGYHLLRMVMQEIELHDTLVFEAIPLSEVTLYSPCTFIPLDGRNLVYKAIELIRDRYGIQDGVKVSITKKIPVAAGLAGGSADAAAAVEAMDEMFGLSISDDVKLQIGQELGADVPFCMTGGTALAEGIGEKLTGLPSIPDCRILLVKPRCSISTKEAYQAIDKVNIVSHPDIDGIVAELRENDLYGVCGRFGNVLELVSTVKHPEIENIKKKMLEFGAINAMMSGSGPTVFGVFDNDNAVRKAYEAFKAGEYSKTVYLTAPVGR